MNVLCRLKNRQSKLFQQLHGLKARQRTLLTGTPLQNNLQELWMLLHFLDAAKFESLETFQQDFPDLSHGDQVTANTLHALSHLPSRLVPCHETFVGPADLHVQIIAMVSDIACTML